MIYNDDTLIERLKLMLKEGTFRHADHSWVKEMANPPASPDDLLRAETLLGYPLPSLLRRIYLEVANGGIGPGLGLVPLFTHEGQDPYEDYSLVDTTLWEYRYRSWPEKVCLICHWGCAILSIMDCSQPEYPVLREYGSDDEEDPHVLEAPSLLQWFQNWLDRKPMFNFNGIYSSPWDSESSETENNI